MVDLLSTWFAYPVLLGFLAVLPGLAVLLLYARGRRRRAYALLGHAAALLKLQQPSAVSRRWRTLCLFLGLGFLIVGAAGPRWGRMPSAAIQGPDRALILVLDVSRSMLAEQPSRQDLARRALRDLAATLSSHGGPRIGLVIFAAHARLAFPLTGDYDHLLEALGHIDADDLPPSMRPREGDGAVSGTRIGEALRLALHVLDPKVGGDILLLSDGDDPAGDNEWLQGAEEARRHHVPVHALAIGNPAETATIPWGNGVLEFGGRPVLTRLQEKPLQEIARRTGGTYVAAHTKKLALGTLLATILASHPGDTGPDPEATLPIWQPRYIWFLAPAFVFLALTMLGRERQSGRANLADGRLQSAFLNLPAAVLAALLVSAAPLPDVDRLLRLGNDAFERGENKESLRFFEDAEVFAPDPALVAFNKAAALYRLERFGEAALHYQRCLEDAGIPALRRSRAFFQMGNAYVRESQGAGRPYLEKALDAYRACLSMEETPAEVRIDARHNLELARLLWLKTLPDPDDPPRSDDRKPKDPKNPEREDMKDGKSAFKADEPGSRDATDSGKGQSSAKSKKAASGSLTVLPDESELVPLSPQETEAHLENIAQRILQERRHYRRHTVLVPENVKDW